MSFYVREGLEYLGNSIERGLANFAGTCQHQWSDPEREIRITTQKCTKCNLVRCIDKRDEDL